MNQNNSFYNSSSKAKTHYHSPIKRRKLERPLNKTPNNFHKNPRNDNNTYLKLNNTSYNNPQKKIPTTTHHYYGPQITKKDLNNIGNYNKPSYSSTFNKPNQKNNFNNLEKNKNENSNNFNVNNNNKVPDNHQNLYENDNFYYYNNLKNIPNNPHYNNHNKSQRTKSVENINSNNSDKYKLLCQNCYNKKITSESIKNLINNKDSEKDNLNRTFIKANPYLFEDEMNRIQKQKIKSKIIAQDKLQQEAANKLFNIKKNSLTKTEKLQKYNEYSINPFETKHAYDPRYFKIKNIYDKKEEIINENKKLYRVNEPRKEIEDYYNKCVYSKNLINNLGQENLNKDLDDYKKNYMNELKKQINEDKKMKKKEREDKIREEKQAIENLDNYMRMNKKQNVIDEQMYERNYNDDNKILAEYKKNRELQEKQSEMEFQKLKEIKMKQEDDDNNKLKKIEKNKNYCNYYNWLKNLEDDKKKKKIKTENENQKWNNFTREYDLELTGKDDPHGRNKNNYNNNIYNDYYGNSNNGNNENKLNDNCKCRHGISITRCNSCNKKTNKDRMVRFYCSSTTGYGSDLPQS